MTVRRASIIAVVAALAMALSACGDDETTVTETTPATTAATPTTTTPTSTATSTTATSTTATTSSTTTGTSTVTCDFNKGEIYSEVSGTCVQQRDGNNPCPAGEVPMADSATCVKE